MDSIPANSFNIALLLALSFEPFIMETILGGNSSAVGFLAMALFLYFDYMKKDIASGFTLGFLIYKPTFLVLILPMLLVARKIKVLAGFVLCCLFTALLSIMIVGRETCVEYVRFLLGFSTLSFGSDTILRTWKYVDIFSFCRLLFGDISPPVLLIIITATLIILFFSVKLWWKMQYLDDSVREIVKASVLTLTIIINLHFGIYDCVLLVLSALLTLNALYRNFNFLESTDHRSGFIALLVTNYTVPWLSQSVASFTGFQMFTITVLIMGSYQIILANTYFKRSYRR